MLSAGALHAGSILSGKGGFFVQQFRPNFDSLRTYRCPDWFRDAKFGIWSHWGPQSVPMFGDWYARNMYVQGHPAYLYHLRHYGHPSKFGYKDLCALWKAERFDPEGLMELYVKAGARFFVAQAMHHDHFFNYPSNLNRFNSMQIGPHKDICGMWKAAAEKFHLPFGLSEHLAPSFSWWYTNKGADSYGPYAGVPYDGNDPAYRDFYFDNYEHIVEGGTPGQKAKWWLTLNTDFHRYWLRVMREIIDLYQPDLLYTDGELPFGQRIRTADGYQDFDPGDWRYGAGLEAVSHLYNTSIQKYGENRAVYTQKDHRPEVYQIGVLDKERIQAPEIACDPWQMDTCIGNWFYDAHRPYKKPEHIIETLVDVISKNGTLLLNIIQLPDGSIDEETRFILQQLAAWFQICGEAVYGTRPWRIFGEGENRVQDGTPGNREAPVPWNSADYRFTQKDGTVYAFMMRAPENRVAVIKSFTAEERVGKVRLLGQGEVPFMQNFGILTVKLPPELPLSGVNALAIQIETAKQPKRG